MTIHLLVEGTSEQALLDLWVSRLLKTQSIRVHPHQGKGQLPPNPHGRPDPKRRGLLDQLPAKLRGFANAANAGKNHVVVLVDADADDPIRLTDAIAKMASEVAPGLSVTVSLAVEETEAFYLGDLAALKKAFPRANMAMARKYVPDSVCGTAELFGKIVDDGGINKVAWAEAIGPALTTRANASRSPSFRRLVRGLLALQRAPSSKKKVRAVRRHPSRNKREPGRRRSN